MTFQHGDKVILTETRRLLGLSDSETRPWRVERATIIAYPTPGYTDRFTVTTNTYPHGVACTIGWSDITPDTGQEIADIPLSGTEVYC